MAAPTSPTVMGDDSLTIKFEVSGIPVILRRVTANNVVAANLYLLGGSRQLTSATQGIELMLLEASERGTQKYPRDLLRTKMARLGSAIGVSAGVDWTSVGLRATTAGFDSTWAIMADRIVAPRLDPADVEFVREQFVTAVSQRKDSPDALLDFLADSMTFDGHPYALEPTGTEASLKGITGAQLRAYHASQMVTSRMMLVVVGNVSRTRVEKLVRETIGRLPRGSYAWSPPAPPADLPSGYVVEKRALPTNYLQGYFHGPRATSQDYAALRLACAVLSGRLFGEVRQRRNLSYSVNAPFVEHAFSLGGLYVTTTQPDEVLSIMLQQVKALQDGIITQEGLEQLVQQFIVTYFLDNETNADQANMLARAELYQGDFRRASRFVQELRAVKPEDIQRAARTYMRKVRWAYVGDPAKVTPARLLRF
ncbi:MAG: M16 family metallopeptidase [Gemmatimonas sp.]|uniref:M16 family metallopeptidase n=1 Tax=Gemmatimonas sp. TaxID=1962908 RepID=UPI0022C78A2A|nr:pitrilysin family protein [Gemmatimonas sp.]MCZ8011384.1 pitrilysin family protein [Gemmatimonas sp.]